MDAALITNSYNSRRNTTNVVAAYDNNYLEKTLSKIWNALAFLNEHTDGGFFKLRQVSDTALLKRASVYKIIEGQKVESGWMSQIQGINADKPRKIRGDRTDLLFYEEGGCHAPGTKVVMADGHLKKVEEIIIGDKVMGDDGTPRTVIELHHGIDLMYKITPNNGIEQIVNSNHIIYGKYRDYYRKTYDQFEIKAKDFYNMITKSPRKKDGYKLIQSDLVKFDYSPVPIDPYLFGFWLGDGHKDDTKFTSKDLEIINYLKEYAKSQNLHIHFRECENSKNCYHIRLSKSEGYLNPLKENLRQLGVFNNKFIPDCYIYNSEDILLNVLAGLIDSDGSYDSTKKVVEITLYEEHKSIIDSIALICRILGMRISLSTRISKQRIINGKIIKGGVVLYRLRILYGHSRIPTKIKRKLTTERDNSIYRSSKDRMSSTFKIEPYGEGEYYGFSLDGNLLFLLEDFTICHNSWPDSTKAFILGDALVGAQGSKFGIKVIGGR